MQLLKNKALSLALSNKGTSAMEEINHETTAQQERDGHIIRRVVIIILVVFTIAAIVMTILYGLPWAK